MQAGGVAQELIDFRERAATEEQRAKSLEKRGGQAHALYVYIRPMQAQPFPPKKRRKSAPRATTLRARFEACRQELGTLDWLSEGSVSEGHPGAWRWTRKVKAKTVTVALSRAQAEAFRTAIATHRRLEELIREMRALSQTYLLETIEGPPRRRQRQSVPNQR
jgi:hypothetical protein